MLRVAATAVLWFLMVVFLWDIIVSVAGVPRNVGPALAVGAALWISGLVMRFGHVQLRRQTGTTPSRRTARRQVHAGR
jgi:hypothetical protein